MIHLPFTKKQNKNFSLFHIRLTRNLLLPKCKKDLNKKTLLPHYQLHYQLPISSEMSHQSKTESGDLLYTFPLSKLPTSNMTWISSLHYPTDTAWHFCNCLGTDLHTFSLQCPNPSTNTPKMLQEESPF